MSMPSGENHWNWKGENLNYWGVHSWLRFKNTKENRCFQCGKEGKTDWANKSGKYLRDIKDYMELCRSCHMQYDGKSKLTPRDIVQIRKSYKGKELSQGKLATKYGVSKMNIYNIIHRKKWAHIV